MYLYMVPIHGVTHINSAHRSTHTVTVYVFLEGYAPGDSRLRMDEEKRCFSICAPVSTGLWAATLFADILFWVLHPTTQTTFQAAFPNDELSQSTLNNVTTF